MTPSTTLSALAGPDRPVDARGAAATVGLSLAAFWRGVAAGTFPKPFYPAPRAPRWSIAELREALAATRAKPGEPMRRRRASAEATAA
jgi:predicted DNA-binding transcriptional regulator AlpA